MDKTISKRDVVIGVAVHKPYCMPVYPVYLPIHVGAALNPGACPVSSPTTKASPFRAQTQATPSSRASTGGGGTSTWMRKGLIHYRRLSGSPDPARRHAEDPYDRVATGEELRSLVEAKGVVLAKRRNYYIETVYDHHSHTFDGAQFDACRACSPTCARSTSSAVPPHAIPLGAHLQHVCHEGGFVRCLWRLAVPRLGRACRSCRRVWHDAL